MVLGASMLSRLSTALTQRALTNAKPRHALFFSAELAVYGIIFLLTSMFTSQEGLKVSDRGEGPGASSFLIEFAPLVTFCLFPPLTDFQ